MTQNRPPPAYQEYASNMIARTYYRVMSLAERGLLYSMRLECWVNHNLPSDPAVLAKILGYDLCEISDALPAIMPLFSLQDGVIVCPELEYYRSHLDGIRAKQSDGGKKGSAKTNSKHKAPVSKANQGVQGVATKTQVTRESLVQLSSVQSSTTQPREKDLGGECETYKEWMRGVSDPAFDPSDRPGG